MVVESDAIIDPGAVMIHSFNASFAFTTMMATGRLVGLAHVAETNALRIQLIQRVLGTALLDFCLFNSELHLLFRSVGRCLRGKRVK